MMLRISLFLSLVFLLCQPAVAAEPYSPPKTPYGLPDISGVWNFSAQTPLERPIEFGNREFLSEAEAAAIYQRRLGAQAAGEQQEANVAQQVLNTENARSTGAVNRFWMESTEHRQNPRTSLITYPINGRLPAVQEGVAVQRSDSGGIVEYPGERPVRYTHGGIDRTGPEDRGLSERCIVFNSGPPLLSGPYNNNIQIIQNKDHVVVLTEMGFDARIIPLSDKAQPRNLVDERITQWSGISQGYFEGETLVVETRNFTPLIASLGMRERAYGDASKRLLIERFSPTGPGTMNYEFTIDDTTTFTDKIVVLMPMTRVEGLIYEYACHPGNYAMRNILRGARTAEAEQ